MHNGRERTTRMKCWRTAKLEHVDEHFARYGHKVSHGERLMIKCTHQWHLASASANAKTIFPSFRFSLPLRHSTHTATLFCWFHFVRSVLFSAIPNNWCLAKVSIVGWKKTDVFFVASSEYRIRFGICWVLHTWLRASRICHLIIAFRFDSFKKKSDKIQCDVYSVKELIESQDKCEDFFVRSTVESPRTKNSHQRNRETAKWWNELSRLLMGYRWIRFIYLFIFLYSHRSSYSRRENSFHVAHICCRNFCSCTLFCSALIFSRPIMTRQKDVVKVFATEK